MDLLDRYLHAIRRNLPSAKADDIVAELRDELLARQEDREEALARPLTRSETSNLLKDFGHPLVVASRYRPHQYLIGPEVFPFYFATMRIVLLIIAAVFIAVAVGTALFGGQEPVQAFAQAMGGIWSAVLINLALVTIVFAVLERNGFPAEHLAKWIPDQLPDIADKQKGQWESAMEVAFGIAFLLWWTGVIHLPYATGGPDFRLEADPALAQFYWPILFLSSAQLVHNLIQWLRPRWKTLRLVIGGLTAVGGLTLLAMLYRFGHWVTIVSTGMSAQQAANLDTSVNLGLGIAIVVVGVVLTLGCMGGAWKLVSARIGRA